MSDSKVILIDQDSGETFTCYMISSSLSSDEEENRTSQHWHKAKIIKSYFSIFIKTNWKNVGKFDV